MRRFVVAAIIVAIGSAAIGRQDITVNSSDQTSQYTLQSIKNCSNYNVKAVEGANGGRIFVEVNGDITPNIVLAISDDRDIYKAVKSCPQATLKRLIGHFNVKLFEEVNKRGKQNFQYECRGDVFELWSEGDECAIQISSFPAKRTSVIYPFENVGSTFYMPDLYDWIVGRSDVEKFVFNFHPHVCDVHYLPFNHTKTSQFLRLIGLISSTFSGVIFIGQLAAAASFPRRTAISRQLPIFRAALGLIVAATAWAPIILLFENLEEIYLAALRNTVSPYSGVWSWLAMKTTDTLLHMGGQTPNMIFGMPFDSVWIPIIFAAFVGVTMWLQQIALTLGSAIIGAPMIAHVTGLQEDNVKKMLWSQVESIYHLKLPLMVLANGMNISDVMHQMRVKQAAIVGSFLFTAMSWYNPVLATAFAGVKTINSFSDAGK